MSGSSLAFNQVRALANKGARLLFIDNLCSAIIILVILHHITVIYSGSSSFYYLETKDFPATDLLAIFTALNQAWFMGAFFLLSSYFTLRSFNRKGTGAFLKGRLLRLGIPLVFFYFVLYPVAVLVGVNATTSSITGITTQLTWQDYPRLVGMGPLWFVTMLLVMVEMALNLLSERRLVELGLKCRVVTVSNLLVVLRSEFAASTVINTGSLY